MSWILNIARHAVKRRARSVVYQFEVTIERTESKTFGFLSVISVISVISVASVVDPETETPLRGQPL